MRIPTFVNSRVGLSEAMRSVLTSNGRLLVQRVAPDRISEALRGEVNRRTARVLVVGGDGTISAAAAVLAHTRTELAVVPAGTLNHFARDYGIPLDLEDALALALTGAARAVDLGQVNGRSFINTSAVGVYVRFVRVRERLERLLGYRLASLLAALRVLLTLRRFRVTIETGEQSRAYDTTLVFVGVGERAVRFLPTGHRTVNGDALLHVLVPRPGTRMRIARRYAFSAPTSHASGSPMRLADELLADSCTIELRRRLGWVALDGELVLLQAPLHYRLDRAALRVVLPPT